MTMTVLLIEDDPDVRMMLSLFLQRSGFEVVQANNGEDGCELYRANRERVRAVVVDAVLPGLDGPSTIARLRKCNPHVRFCFITGIDSRELYDCGPARVLQKPFSLDEFLQTVRQLAAASATS
jgi:two-component system cell cycle sensor histidine kinase/response regulator CckA